MIFNTSTFFNSINIQNVTTFDRFGNGYTIMDGRYILKIDTSGNVTIFAGSMNAEDFQTIPGLAINSGFSQISKILFDSKGNAYILDILNFIICKIDTSGYLTIIAGYEGDSNRFGIPGFINDGYLGNFLTNIVIDSFDNIYLLQSYRNVNNGIQIYVDNYIIKVDSSGELTIFAGTGVQGIPTAGPAKSSNLSISSADIMCIDSLGNKYFTDISNNLFLKIDTNEYLTIIPNVTPSSMGNVPKLVIDSYNNVYIPNISNNTISKLDINGNLTTFAGTGVAGTPTAGGLATYSNLILGNNLYIDPSGNIYIVQNMNSILKVDTSGYLTIFAGTGNNSNFIIFDEKLAIECDLKPIDNITFDNSGNVYIEQSYTFKVVYKINASGILSLYSGSVTKLGFITMDSFNNIYMVDSINYSVKQINANGQITRFAGLNTLYGQPMQVGLATSSPLNIPRSLTVDLYGNIYILDATNIGKVNTSGYLTVIAGSIYNYNQTTPSPGLAINSSLNNFSGIVVDSTGNVYIADPSNNTIDKIDSNGMLTIFAGYNPSYNPKCITVDPSNNIYICYGDYNVVKAFTYTNYTYLNAFNNLNKNVSSIIVDSSKNVYFSSNNNIYKTNTNGSLTIVAGSSTGVSGITPFIINDSTNFNTSGITIDSANNLYIINNYHKNILKIDSNLYVSTFANITTNVGTITATSIAYDSIGGNVYYTDTISHKIYKRTNTGIVSNFAGSGVAGNTNGGAASARLNRPNGLAVDNLGNVYIADTSSNRIARVNTNNVLSNFAGTGVSGIPTNNVNATGVNAKLNFPTAVAVDSTGNVYIADTYNNVIEKVTLGSPNNIITIIAGSQTGVSGTPINGQNATDAKFNKPTGIAVDLSLNIYIADTGNNMIIKFKVGSTITVLATDIKLVNCGITVDSNKNVYVMDSSNNVITKIDINGNKTNITGIFKATNHLLNNPTGIAMDNSGNIYIADTSNNMIEKVDTSGNMTLFAGKSTGVSGAPTNNVSATSSNLSFPTAVAVDLSGNVYIADTSNNMVEKVDKNKNLTIIAGPGIKPTGLVVDLSGNVYYVDASNNTVVKINTFGTSSNIATDIAISNNGITVDSSNNVYVVDSSNILIKQIDIYGNITTPTNITAYNTSSAAKRYSLKSPSSVAVDLCGNVYIGDDGNKMIEKVDAIGNIYTIATNVDISNCNIALDTDGNIYYYDYINNKIIKIFKNGRIKTIAGNGSYGTQTTGRSINSPLPTITSIYVKSPYYILLSANLGSTNNYIIELTANSCFLKNTKILTLQNNKEKYIPIQNLRKGDLVKTEDNGYLPIDIIQKSTICHRKDNSDIKNKLYVCSTTKYPDLFENLVITGCHSVLVNNLTEKQREKTVELVERILVTGKKYRLLACLDDKATVYPTDGDYEIWHLALENEDEYSNYGIYANGLLVESASKRMMELDYTLNVSL